MKIDAPHQSIYRSLDPSQQEVRVLTLHKDRDDAPIVCSIEQGPLASVKPFSALSYCWGVAGDTKDIVVEGIPVLIRANLWYFLHSLRATNGQMRIWVDYICIDQLNHVEKGHQVGMMTAIYKGAVAVYAWLGEASTSSNKAFQYLNEDLAKQTMTESRDVIRKRRRAAINAFQTVLRRPYWTRTWVIQECCLPRQLWLMAGRQVASWEAFAHAVPADAAKFSYRAEGKTALIRRTFSAIRDWRSAKLAKSTSRTWRLRNLVDNFAHCECYEPRDRIFAMIGICPVTERKQVVVNYSCPFLQVCFDNFSLLKLHYLSRLPDDLVVIEIASINTREFHAFLSSMLRGDKSEVRQLSYDSTLRSQLKFQAPVAVHRSPLATSFYTFAAVRTIGSPFTPFLSSDLRDKCDVYLSAVYLEGEWYDGRVGFQFFMYSSMIPRNNDLLLEGDLGCAWLARQINGKYVVMDSAYTSAIASEGIAAAWASEKIPTDQWAAQVPVVFRESTTNTLIMLDGPASAEVFRMADLWSQESSAEFSYVEWNPWAYSTEWPNILSGINQPPDDFITLPNGEGRWDISEIPNNHRFHFIDDVPVARSD